MVCVLIKLSFRDWEPSDSLAFKNCAVGPCGDVSWVSLLYYCSTCVLATLRSSRLVQDISVCTDPPTHLFEVTYCACPQSICMLVYNSLIFDTVHENINFNHYVSCYTIIMVCTSWFIIWFLNIRVSEEPKLKLCSNKSLRHTYCSLFIHVMLEMWFDVP